MDWTHTSQSSVELQQRRTLITLEWAWTSCSISSDFSESQTMTVRLLHVQQSLFQYKLMTISENKFLSSKEQRNSSQAIPITDFQPHQNT
jgi:hypothetical protein